MTMTDFKPGDRVQIQLGKYGFDEEEGIVTRVEPANTTGDASVFTEE